MHCTTEIKKRKAIIDRALERFMDKVLCEMECDDPFSVDMVQQIRHLLLSGGKRLRAILFAIGYYLAGGTNEKAIVEASLSIEFIHLYLLIHDDIIDRDDIRHGVSTLHALYTKRAKEIFLQGDSEHFGRSMAIIAGDFTCALGHRALYESRFSTDKIIRALTLLQKIIARTVVGQTQDMVMEYSRSATEEQIIAMYTNKTACYTFEAPLLLGATLAGMCEEDPIRKTIADFSIPLGIAFQAQDDLLGVFGDEKTTGKPTFSDIAEGKQTLLYRYTYDFADEGERLTLNTLYGKNDITVQEVTIVKAIMEHTGAKRRVKDVIDSYLKKAKKALIPLSKTQHQHRKESIAFLNNFIHFLQVREY